MDEILAIVPLSQAFFILLMVLVADRILDGKTWSVIQALNSFGLKSSLGPDDGRFWSVGFLPICISFGLALFNIFLLRSAVSRSMKKANLSASLTSWQSAAVQRTAGLSDPQKETIQASFKAEIDARLRRYKAKRISTEITASLASMTAYANILLIFFAHRRGVPLTWAWLDFFLLSISALVCLSLHRSSIRYAISRILPLKVYVGVLTGELVFFEELTD